MVVSRVRRCRSGWVPGGIPPKPKKRLDGAPTFSCLPESSQDLFRCANASHAGEELAYREVMRFRADGGHCVLGEDKLVAAVERSARCGFDSEVRGDSTQDDRSDIASAELLIQIGSIKGAPLAFGDDEIAHLKSRFGHYLGGVGRGRSVSTKGRIVDWKIKGFSHEDADEDDGSSLGAHSIRKLSGLSYDVRRGVWRKLASDYAVLQVDQHQCGGLWFEFKVIHRFSTNCKVG
jgi:hypothetical protein